MAAELPEVKVVPTRVQATKRYVTVGLWTLLVFTILTGLGIVGFVFYVFYSMSHGGLC